MDALTSIKVFRQVVESGSFVSAAERLDLSTAMVSKHVMHAEKRIGVRLLNRNSRSLSLTEAGKVYFERCKTILEDLQATELELGSLNAVPRGTLRVTCPSWFANQRLADLVAEYRGRCPDVVLDISFEDRLVDLVEEGCDLALRLTRGGDSLPAGLVARPLRAATFYLAASRAYLQRNGTPRSLEELARHEFVAVGNATSLLLKGPEGAVEVPLRIALRYRSLSGVPNAVIAGIGIAPLPWIYFEDTPFRQLVTPVLPEYSLGDLTLYAIYVSRRFVPLKIRTFIDFLLENAPRMPALRASGAER